jgi:hypothetical protein
MDKIYTVAVIVGSLRKDSINRHVANALIGLAPASLKLSIVEIGQLPLYNQDSDENPPAAWTAFRERIKSTDAVLFVTPEYNRSIPAPLKNASRLRRARREAARSGGKPSRRGTCVGLVERNKRSSQLHATGQRGIYRAVYQAICDDFSASESASE